MQRNLPATKDALKKGHCVPCEGGTSPLTETEENNYHDATPSWVINRESTHKLTKEFTFNNFLEAIDFVNKVAKIAESEGHHPNLYLHDYKKLTIDLYTHAIGGLSTNDFILATKIDELTL